MQQRAGLKWRGGWDRGNLGGEAWEDERRVCGGEGGGGGGGVGFLVWWGRCGGDPSPEGDKHL